jgi:N-acetylglucosamine kinase-like BadF-type ATPase
VQQAAEAGDEVALTILSVGARELAGSAASVVRQLGLAESEFSFVLAGGILQAVPRLTGALQAMLAGMAPRSATVRLDREPALGAVELALSEARGEGRVPAYKT